MSVPDFFYRIRYFNIDKDKKLFYSIAYFKIKIGNMVLNKKNKSDKGVRYRTCGQSVPTELLYLAFFFIEIQIFRKEFMLSVLENQG